MTKMSEYAATIKIVVDAMKTAPKLGAEQAALTIDQTVAKLGNTAAGLLYALVVETALQSITDGYSGSVPHFKIQEFVFSDAGEDIRKKLGEDTTLWQAMTNLEASGYLKGFKYSKVGKNGKRASGWFLTALDSAQAAPVKTVTLTPLQAALRAAIAKR